ncbi:hypothetical protein LCGC14_2467910 [marine sediment metagenome]|uniref:Uncharacterized protein n=1 Tax=marine sediment metagenome TaxID=412755 RepID=A0A0F9BBB5_9ZZZZ
MVLMIKTKKVLTLRCLNAVALKYIFDKSHLTKDEERKLEDGIEWWSKKVDITPYERKELRAVVECLIHDKEGRFDSEKFAYKKGDIDYRKVYTEGI